MKRIILVGILVGTCSVLQANVPHFVTPRMMDRRNGLTDDQYEALWKAGKNPSVSPATARDWVFRASRYQNVTNWLDICGKTNDFAALSYDLQDKNFNLIETNKCLVATNSVLITECQKLADAIISQIEQTEAYSNAWVIAEGMAAASAAKIRDEIADLEAKIVKYEEYQKKYPILKSIFAAMITDAQNRIKILQALTSSSSAS